MFRFCVIFWTYVCIYPAGAKMVLGFFFFYFNAFLTKCWKSVSMVWLKRAFEHCAKWKLCVAWWKVKLWHISVLLFHFLLLVRLGLCNHCSIFQFNYLFSMSTTDKHPVFFVLLAAYHTMNNNCWYAAMVPTDCHKSLLITVIDHWNSNFKIQYTTWSAIFKTPLKVLFESPIASRFIDSQEHIQWGK